MTLNIHDKQVQFIVDTGATVDLVDSKTYDLLRNKVTLNIKSNTKVYAYEATKPLPLKGRFQGTIESKTRYTVSQFYVVEGTGGNLLSAKRAQDLGLIKMVNIVTQMPPNTKESHTHTHGEQSLTPPDTSDTSKQAQAAVKASDPKIQAILNKYYTVFVGEGKLKNQQIKLHIRTDVQPVIQPQRRISYEKRGQQRIREISETRHYRKSY